MRPAAVGALLGTLVGVGLWSCSVNRASDDLRCTSNADCAVDRVCVQGYCIAGANPRLDAGRPDAAMCPAICTTCDFKAGTCTIVGTGGGNITCPAGWNCNITCAQSGACGSITCNTSDCNVTCTGPQACGTISCTSGNCTETCSGGAEACGTLNCGTGACSATCTGADPACGTVNCSNSCKCDVSCNGVTNACPATMTCPDAPGNQFCTVNGSNGQPCSSSFAQQCDNC